MPDEENRKAQSANSGLICVRLVEGPSERHNESRGTLPYMGSTGNSCEASATPVLGHCACCHAYGQVRPHWDHGNIKLCDPCRRILFVLEGHGDLSHSVYAFHQRLQATGGRM